MDGRIKLKGRFLTHLIYPYVMAIVLLLVGIWESVENMERGTVLISVAIAGIIITTVMFVVNQRLLLRELIDFALNYTRVQREVMDDMIIPCCLVDIKGDFMWKDQEMKKLTEHEYGKNVFEIFRQLEPEHLETLGEEIEEKHLLYKNRHYRVELKRVNTAEVFNDKEILQIENQEYLIAMYLFDETTVLELKKENQDQKLVVGLIYVDNYEEALQSVEDVRASLLSALIDRKINKFVANMEGIARKLEKDKYFVVFKHKYLEGLRSDKFSIVDEVKTVGIGNEMQVTISMGIGVGADDYDQLGEYARAAMDLALARGGDQAVVKEGENVYYYGGKTRLVEKNTRVKARVKAHALRGIIEPCDKVLIMGHKIGDTDSFGAAVGIYKAAQFMNKQAHIVINDVTAALRPMVNCFVKSDDYDPNFIVGSNEALSMMTEETLVVVVDVNKPSRTECPELLNRAKSIVVLDHHRQTAEVIENAELAYIEPYASSACEMVAEILQYLQDNVKLKPVEADAMYAGMVVDTNNFLQKTGVRTFEAAAFLRKQGADVIRVKKMFRETFSNYKLRTDAVGRAEIFLGCFAITTCSSHAVAHAESPTVLGAQIANELLDINGIEASFVLTEYNGSIYVSARSIDTINVQLILERMGGGGHMNMAGVQLPGAKLEKVKQQLIEIVKTMKAENSI